MSHVEVCEPKDNREGTEFWVLGVVRPTQRVVEGLGLTFSLLRRRKRGPFDYLKRSLKTSKDGDLNSGN